MRIVLTRGKSLGKWRRPRRWLSRDAKVYSVVVNRTLYLLVAKRWWGVSIYLAVRDDRIVWSYVREGAFHGAFQMKRRDRASATSDAQHLAAAESALFSKLHPLVSHCCCTKYDDQTPRKPGWWTVKTMGSAWVVEVKDPDTCSRLVVVQQTLDDALALASVLLESDEAPWEPDPWLKANEAKQNKKK